LARSATSTACPSYPAEHTQPARAGNVGERARGVGIHPATRDSDVHVDEHLAYPVAHRRVDGRFRVDRDRDAGAALGHRAQTVVVEGFVREQEIVGEPRARQAQDLSWSRGGEAGVAAASLLARE
jgi:hypothetical protein